MKSYFPLLFLVLVSCFGKSIDYPQLLSEPETPNDLVITNVSIFNGIDSVMLTQQDIWIQNGMIKDIGSNLPYPTSSKVIDGTDKYLLPGFVDTHVHLMGAASAPWSMVKPDPDYHREAWLAAGVTTVYDLGGMASQSKKLKEAVKAGKKVGPDIFFTGSPITAPNGHPVPASKALLPFPFSWFIGMIIETADEGTNVDKLVASYQEDEVDYFKIINDQLPEGSAQIDPMIMQQIIDKAHDAGYKVFVHTGSEPDIQSTLTAGGDVIAHFPYRSALQSKTVEQLKTSDVSIIHTYTGFLNTALMAKGTYQPSTMDLAMHPSEWLTPVTGEDGKQILKTEVLGKFSETLVQRQPTWKSSIEQLREAEIPFTIGTDSPLPGSYPGSSFHEEMRHLVKLGYSTYQVLKAATSDGAKLFLSNPDFGIIEPQKKSNLLLLNKNPLKDIANTQDIHCIIKGDQLFYPTYLP
tara:strand:+ start:108 stop:1502 length:1395 start_codon:yes stop_codon:yes gene_type:complete